jgi:hypothetical protein
MAFAQPITEARISYPATTAPVAFIYVANNWSEIYAYTAAENGTLTPVPGSPFASGTVKQMVVNGKYLFGIDANNIDIDSFLMEPDGALSLVEKNNVLQYNADSCSYEFGPITVDHSGKSLYNVTLDSGCFSVEYESFEIAESTGKLSYQGMGNTGVGPLGGAAAFLGSDKFAFSAYCTSFDGEASGGVTQYQRDANGVLNYFGGVGLPLPQNGENFYCPYSNVATDPTNHFIVALEEQDSDGDAYGSPRLAIFSASDAGEVTTKSTYANMVTPTAITVTQGANNWIRMAPSGELLAVGSLEVFHFDGSKLTTYANLSHYLGSEQISQLYWDNANHLYAIGETSNPGQGKLFVFTVTPTSVTEAPGSPYSIPNPSSIIVHSRT